MKIFTSYSRADGGEFAQKVYDYFRANSQDVFTDVNNIKAGDAWSKTIEQNISVCDVFIVILTFAALTSAEVEKEVLQAREQRKRIIPAKYRSIRYDEIPWGLNANQGIEFESRDELVTRLYEKIFAREPPKPPKPKTMRKILYKFLLVLLIFGSSVVVTLIAGIYTHSGLVVMITIVGIIITVIVVRLYEER